MQTRTPTLGARRTSMQAREDQAPHQKLPLFRCAQTYTKLKCKKFNHEQVENRQSNRATANIHHFTLSLSLPSWKGVSPNLAFTST
eukprot:5420824-Amphidinium_carterae.1